MKRFLFVAFSAAVLVTPVAAQENGRTVGSERVAANFGPIQDQIYAPGLPGVALGATNTTDRPSGPGGLSNGVGGVGSMVPNSSSSNGQLLNDEGNSIGIPFGSPRRSLID